LRGRFDRVDCRFEPFGIHTNCEQLAFCPPASPRP
jgi:hypothetical protein